MPLRNPFVYPTNTGQVLSGGSRDLSEVEKGVLALQGCRHTAQVPCPLAFAKFSATSFGNLRLGEEISSLKSQNEGQVADLQAPMSRGTM